MCANKFQRWPRKAILKDSAESKTFFDTKNRRLDFAMVQLTS